MAPHSDIHYCNPLVSLKRNTVIHLQEMDHVYVDRVSVQLWNFWD